MNEMERDILNNQELRKTPYTVPEEYFDSLRKEVSGYVRPVAVKVSLWQKLGGASKFLEYYSRGESEIKAIIKIANEKEDQNYCGMRLYKTQSTLTGGAFYKDPSEFFTEEIWLCPVTLFLLGRYPERILIYKINKNHLHCPIFIE